MQLPYEKEAMNGYEMPDGLSLWQQNTYLALRSLYQQYKAGIIDRATAISEKQKIQKSAKDAESQETFNDKLIRSIADLWKSIDIAGCEYAKNPTIEHADAFYKAVYKVGVRHGTLTPKEATP